MDIKKLEASFNNCLKKLIAVYKKKGSDYFFTEKEIHSYFYHLCQCDNSFDVSDYGLIHTEYPTPFKCKQIDTHPFIEKIDDSDKGMRAHIDLVLLNPNFIEWIIETDANREIIYGLGGINFDDYIPGFRKEYSRFANLYKEPILLSAIEFKFFRHAYAGTKYSIKGIVQDIEKLKLLKTYGIGKPNITFAKNILSVVFIGNRFNNLEDEITKTPEITNDICKILSK